MSPCSFSGCTRYRKARGLCAGHYRQQMAGVPLHLLPHRDQLICTFPGCGRVRNSRLYCPTHHQQQKRGVTLVPIGRDHSNGKWCQGCGRSLPLESFSLSGQGDPQTIGGRRHRCRECQRAEETGRTFGLSVDEVRAAWSSFCAICGTTTPGGRYGTFHIDHDHNTNEVRGVLCYKCNSVLGFAEDDADRLKAAIRYLQNPPGKGAIT